MWIQSIKIVNFQKHSHLELEFTDKLNVLYGESDVGKSCIIRAIKWVFFNEPKGDIVRKEKTKKTTVKITLDNNTVVEKIKSASVNAYILYKEGEEEKRFDAVGKTIPEEIQKALQIRTIEVDKENVILNIADQISLPFLIGKSATFRSKLFNKLTGSDIIDKVFQSLNKDILKIGREVKLENEHLEEQQKTLEEVNSEKEKVEKLHHKFSVKYENLKKLQEKYDNLKVISKQLKETDEELDNTIEKLKEIKVVPEDLVIGLKKSIDKLEKYSALRLKKAYINQILKRTEESIKNLKIPKMDIDKLKDGLNRLEKLKGLYSQLLEIDGAVEISDYEIDKYKELIKENEKKYKKILKDIKICPFYKKECPLNKE